MSSKTLPTATKSTPNAMAVVKPKLTTTDRQRISNLVAMTQTIKAVVDAVKAGDVDGTDDMMTILATQSQLVTQLGVIAARDGRPVSAPPAPTDN